MKITFTSGRSITPNLGIVGLSPSLELSGGYDSFIYVGVEGGDLHPDDRRELAEMMIQRWTEYRDSLTPATSA